MFIEPNSVIRILKGVPLDNSYKNTLHFSSRTAQTSAMQNKTKYTLQNQSYQRVDIGVMHVNLSADSIYDCNYLMFQNTSYGVKWFYAFILKVDYVSNEVCKVTYEIDVMQTRFLDVTMKHCFVEREHSPTDNFGDNIVQEPVTCGEYVVSDYGHLEYMVENVVLMSIVDAELTDYGNTYDGVFSGATLWAFDEEDSAGLLAKISEYIQAPDSIVSIYMCPLLLYGVKPPAGGERVSYRDRANETTVSAGVVSTTASFQGYVPKNNKLYIYPFNYMCINNASGQSLVTRYEFFENNHPKFKITGTITQPVKVVLRPVSYKGVPNYSELGGYTQLTTESLTLECYPVCSWAIDSFKAWLAQNSVPIFAQGMTGLASVGAGLSSASMTASMSANPDKVMSGAYNSAGTNTFGGIVGTLTQVYNASIQADVCRGNTMNGCVNFSNNMQMFYKARTHVTGEYAKIIDNFFTMFGYQTNKVKIPNITSRPQFNYIKTKGCNLIGNCPADDIKQISSILDSGVTFWHSIDDVGDYSLNNAPPII